MKFFYLIPVILLTNLTFGQADSVFYSNGDFTVYVGKAVFGDVVLYNAEEDLARLKEREETEDCKVDYTFYYNPLSLIGNYYSYESGECGVIACGVPGSSVSVHTIDITTGEAVPITDLFAEESILSAFMNNGWLNEHYGREEIEGANSFAELINLLNTAQDIEFLPDAFAIKAFNSKEGNATVSFFGKEYIGFDHYILFELLILIEPNSEIMELTESETVIFSGAFSGGFINNAK